MTRITKLLIANRGEIASRVIRSARDLDIATVAVYSEPDARAVFVLEADEAVALPGRTAAETYLRADLVIAAALETGAQAIHPGYGFLSENAEFAQACADAGIVFVGPPASAITAMGSKTAAKQLMSAAGVPVLPGITIDGEDDALPADLAERAAAEVGFPLLVKAAFGGGGRGMRVVESPEGLAEAVEGARREAVGAFGNGAVFLERLVQRPRHIEVQVFADTQGQVVHLFERECSVQRRYQKIIEEAPSPVVDEALREQLGSAAIAAAKAIGYVGAGTVEFILDASGEFFFLEVNTRLQVEHPVTELVTGLDLVALQLAVAEGKPLPPAALAATLTGHAIEARLYAEDVPAGYLPATGHLDLFEIPLADGVRVDAGFRSGDDVSVYYDPMLAKVIAYGADREQAVRLLARTLADSRVHGVVTNRDLLVGILREDEFIAGDIDTGYLTRHTPEQLTTADERRLPVHALAAALADQAERRASAPVLGRVPSGWRNVHNGPQQVTYLDGEREVDVRYRVVASHAGTTVEATVDGDALGAVTLHAASPDRVDLQVGPVRRRVRVARQGESRYVDSVLGSTVFVEAPRFPTIEAEVAAGSLTAPMPGTVVRVVAEPGATVATGDVIVVLEAMKMEHAVKAPQDGVVTQVSVSPGESVDQGTVLAVVSGDDEQSGGDA
ncbi:MAG: ATP-grasp domain-containing protein [Propionibacteriales bacterium]|nr:ATP-grasp domain-containing protein [Propionibacteriales bacterium]